ncbi:MAG: hypothetical protein LUH11_02400 [Candidatus Gastranaerophilales bacterium]|nr:hypothetical protein [Candidatus Gastranaerophilales bacterium]
MIFDSFKNRYGLNTFGIHYNRNPIQHIGNEIMQQMSLFKKGGDINGKTSEIESSNKYEDI